MIALKNHIIHEFIGLKTEIIKSTNSQVVGQTGIVMNETKNMFLLKTKFGPKQISKNHNVWKFTIDDNQVVVDGSLLGKKPYDRLEVSV